uniref:Microprocessor complex subunit DGCR8 n=1 Tax=Ditylenchus dipsaci TaxID=166011 RepID=A0A915DUP7_9BILA
MSENCPPTSEPNEDADEIEKLLEMRRTLLAELGSDESDDEKDQINTSNNATSIAQSDELLKVFDVVNDSAMNSLSDGYELVDEFHQNEETAQSIENIEKEEGPISTQDPALDEDKGQEAENIDGFSSFSSSDEDEEIDESKNAEEIDELLEKAVEGQDNIRKNVRKRLKRVLEYRGTDHFDVLPDGWVEVTHSSGLPVYLHRPSRSCTFARPYFLGPCSVRRHRVPESAIPCYYQKKLLAEADKQSNPENNAGASEEAPTEQPQTSGETQLLVGQQPEEEKCPRRSEILDKLKAPVIKVRSAKDILDSQLTDDALYEYAKNSFRFRNICVYRFNKWSDARTFYKDKKRNASEQRAARSDTSRPGLPGNVQLITVPSFDQKSKPQQRGFYLNPNGKTSISILHEFVQKVLKCTVKYTETETRSCSTPYHCIARLKMSSTAGNNHLQQNEALTSASIRQKLMYLKKQYQPPLPNSSQIDGEQEGQCSEQPSTSDITAKEDDEYITISEGYGNSKKLAKLTAAKKAVESLIPGRIEFDADGMAVGQGTSGSTSTPTSTNTSNLEIFDHIKIGDTRVPELCTRGNQPAPYIILQECLKRSATFGDTTLTLENRKLRHQQHEFTIKVGKHAVTVRCTNKQEGKQKASQKMIANITLTLYCQLQETTWGGILRLYGYEAQQKHKEARKSKESIIKLQGEVRNQNERNGHSSLEANPVILEKLRSEMLKLSEKLVQKTIIEPPTCPDEPLKDPEDGCINANLSDVQPDKYRPANLGYTQPPILLEEQLREMSAKLAELNPQKLGVPVPCLEL